MDFFSVLHDKPKGYCCVKRCRGKKEKHGRFCRRCRDRRYAISNPIAYAWDKLKYSARRRKVAFKLTKEQFKTFCEKTSYHILKGRQKGCLSVDRRDALRGYEIDNIRVLELGANSRKAMVEDRIARDYCYADDDYPF